MTAARSAYQFFAMAQREAIKAEFPDEPFGSISRVIGARWRALPEDEKKEFVALAQEDKERFLREAGPLGISQPRSSSKRRSTSASSSSSSSSVRADEEDAPIIVRSKRKLTAEQMEHFGESAEIIDITSRRCARIPIPVSVPVCFALR